MNDIPVKPELIGEPIELVVRGQTKLSSWKAQGLWTKFEKRASHKSYNSGKACYGSRVLIIGAGPCGLRTAIEAQLLGAKVVVIEKRDRFSRNNVLHLWPFVIADLKALGAKKFYGKFCAGSIDHISIRQLQCILLKVALLLGVEVLEGVGFEGLCEPGVNEGWRANVSPVDHPVSQYNFDVLIGADGRRNTLEGFKRKALRAKLAIAITANFINKHTEAEARVKEISGVSYIFNQKFFQELNEATGIDLENVVYYKDETHYFVMTAKKQSLLNKGVLLQDHPDTTKLLSHDNISSEALMIYALEAAVFSTDNQLPNLEFAVNHYGQPDVAMFDFTAMYAAENACRVVQRKGHKLLMSLVGDSLLEPFWPTGSGCARGFLSSFDACWMLRSWAIGAKSILEVIAERESIYRLLGQTTPENLNKEHMGYAIDPYSRYPNLNVRVVLPFQVKSLLESDETDNVDFVGGVCEEHLFDAEKVFKKRRRDCVIAVDSLLSWMRDQVTGYGLEVIDVCDAFIRGDALCAIISRFRPDLIDFPLPSEENVDPLDIAASQNQIAFDLLHEEHGLSPIMSGFDSVQCTSSDFLTIAAYLSQIYEVFRGEIPQINYPRMEINEGIEDLEPQRSSHYNPKQHSSRPPLAVRHPSGKFLNRRSRVSSSGRDGRTEGDSENSKKCKKRRSDDQSRGTTGREIKVSASHIETDKQHVTGLTNKLEEKLKGSKPIDEKPKDFAKAIGKIEKVHWNVQFTDKKIIDSKTRCLNRKERDDKVPKWSREAFNNKREAMQRKIEGCGLENGNLKLTQFEDQVIDLGSKLKEGNSLKIGRKGSNKVSQMASQLVHKLEITKEDHTVTKTPVQRSVFEFPNKGGSESCHFCDERVYVVEKMTAEGRFFHRNCFRCEYCNTSLRLGNYVFDREGRYGKRFYCTPHYGMVRLYGWKKYDLDGITTKAKFVRDGVSLLTSTNLQIFTEIDERGTTPERVEFENSVDFASEEELLSEMDEDEWTDRNFGVSNVGNNTSDEASDLSDDEDDITPGGIEGHHNIPGKPSHCEDAVLANNKADNSDSDTEIASEEESRGDTSANEEEDCEGEEGIEEGEDDCDGSTTEIETDSEFADDPPYSVPGNIPTIVVDEPEQQVTRINDRIPFGHTHSSQSSKEVGHHRNLDENLSQELQLKTLQYEIEEPIKQKILDRVLPRVNLVPKKWEPLPSSRDYHLACNMSLELKQKYLHGTLSNVTFEKKNVMDSTAQNQFRSVLDMISEKQKLLQPAAKPSAAMQAFLDGAEKLKTNQNMSPLSGTVFFTNSGRNCSRESLSSSRSSNIVNDHSWDPENTASKNEAASLIGKNLKQNGGFIIMNRLNIEKNLKVIGENSNDDPEKCDFEKEILSCPILKVPNATCTDRKNETIPTGDSTFVVQSDIQSFSHSEATDTLSPINGTHKNNTNKVNYPQLDQDKCNVEVQKQKKIRSDTQEDLDSESEEVGSDTESVHHLSESDDIDADIEVDCIYATQKPPRVEIKDEFGVTFKVHECYDQNTCSTVTRNECMLENKENEDSKSIGMSSSDSKDSLNSGLFLETEMSDWTRDGGGGEKPQEGIKKKVCKKKQNVVSKIPASYTHDQQENFNSVKYSKLKSSLTLELETLDFMDEDGVSSPEDMVPPKKQGCCKHSNEDVEMEHCVNVSHYCYLLKKPCDNHFSAISNRKSTPTVGFLKHNTKMADGSTPKVIRQDDTLCASKAEQNFAEAVNPIMKRLTKSEPSAFSSVAPPGKNKYASLGKVVPFSNARDSLDIRKIKSNASGSFKCKDIVFPSYQACNSLAQTVSNCSYTISSNTNLAATTSLQSDLENHNVLNLLETNTVESTIIKKLNASEIHHVRSEPQHNHGLLQLAWSNSNSSDKNKSSNSPHIVQRIEEINNERTKQSNLIRSMVIGRLLKSPEKNRRNSKGSLSPFCVSNSSGSRSSEHVIQPPLEYQGGAIESSSRRNSQHSVICNASAAGNNTAENESHSNNHALEFLKDPNKRDSAEDVSPVFLSSHWSSGSLKEGIERQTQMKLKLSHFPAQYEPVFSSPSFRNRPFNSSLSINSPVTNSPIPASPSPTIFFPNTSGVFFPTKSLESRNRNKSPSFHHSMPDLATFATPSQVRFSTLRTKEWEAYKSASIVNREKARQAARDRARLKSDQDLGLGETDYVVYKKKLRRKTNVPEDDVFDPHAAVVGSSIIAPSPTASCSETPTSTKMICEKTRPISDIFDNVASSIRHNVDFPMAKSNPFLVFPSLESAAGSDFDPPTGDLWLGQSYDNKGCLQGVREIMKMDDYVHLRLHFNQKQHTLERAVAPNSEKSMVQNKIQELFPHYLKQASSHPLSFPSTQTDANSEIFQQEPQKCRSNKLCDSYIKFGENHPGYSSNVHSLSASASVSPTVLYLTKPLVTKASPESYPKPKPIKSKVLSAGILLDEPPIFTPNSDAARKTSEPNIIKDPCPEKNTKKPKDRERLRSIIQAVSAFFSSRSLSNGPSTSNAFSSTPDINKTAGTYFLSREKFSLFKLTPKLHHRDKRVSKSRESLFPTLTASGFESLKDRSGFTSSHSDIVIQRLSASPTPLKSSRANLNSVYHSIATTSHSDADVPSDTSPSFFTLKHSLVTTSQKSLRIQEVKAVRLQLESIESEITKLKTLRMSIVEKLKKEESDNENRDDPEFMEQGLTLAKENQRLARLESELVFKAHQLQLEELQSQAQEKFYNQNLCSIQNTEDQTMRQIVLINELHSLERLKRNLLSKYHKDIENCKAEDEELESKIASFCITPRESNV